MSTYQTCPYCKGLGYIKLPDKKSYECPECGACNGTGSIKK